MFLPFLHNTEPVQLVELCTDLHHLYPTTLKPTQTAMDVVFGIGGGVPVHCIGMLISIWEL